MYTIYDTGNRKTNVHHLSHWWAISLTAMVFVLSWFSHHRLLTLPPSLTVNDLPTHNQSFIAERAWHDLNILTSFGPRPTGSHANEVLAIDFFKRELSYIERNANPNQKIISDLQIVSGSYFINFKPHPMTNIYRNVQNFIVRLAGSEEEENSLRKSHALMLNCHFDSVAGSPGASDDAASCCVMLEVLRVLSQQEKRLRHPVIFLFNGAEETPLQAAHGFITQHRWAKDIRAFLNLESVGSSGKEILFQSGPNHGWLIEMYKNAVPYPNGQVAAEEMFHLGIIPSDTDFRIFRDYGHIPGMDFAHVFNGYRYHTKYDAIDYLPANVLQRTGDNVLALVKRMANSDELTNTAAYVNGRMVYFDFLGYTFIAYTESMGQIMHILVPIVSVILSYYFVQKTKGISRRNVRKEILYGFCVTIFSLFAGILVCYLIATELDFNGKSMSWYNRTYFSVALYCFPTLVVASFFYAQLVRTRDSPLSLALQTQARLNGVNIVWSVGCVVLTIFGFRSAYVLMFPAFVTLIVNTIIGLTKSQNTIRKWLYIHLCGQIFIVLWATHFYHTITAVFIPISGRASGNKNPDITIGIISCFFTIFIGSYLIPLVGLLRNPKSFMFTVAALFLITRISFMTHIDFPYSDDEQNPTPQRHFITHTVRKVYDLNGRVQYTDSGYWFRELDRNAEKTIDSLVAPETPVRQDLIPLCNELPFCGLPSYSCRQLHTGGFWLPGPAPIVENEVQVNATKPLKISDNKWQLRLTMNGSYLYSLQIRPKLGVKLLKWNLFDFIPEENEFNGDRGYFAMVTHGLEAPPLELHMEFDTKTGHIGPLVDVTIVTFHWEFKPTPAFANLLARVPKWAFPVPSIASLQAHVF
ncbi:endoplasmic reticulum metallopeptidase 1-like [Contarinia nasturtii]|uniref:endoplasmic reticulum metallopeptidase 1-like n=1 Tax=Contarinia nasturtii TaxID=265458 RepID=UPI0012D3E714|nr:endoplasmic reticulum metallopeptidase 1-like [Contarinia nasturtii]